jgi:hypothetical protein
VLLAAAVAVALLVVAVAVAEVAAALLAVLEARRSSSSPIVTRVFSSLAVERRISSRPPTSFPESLSMARRGFPLRAPRMTAAPRPRPNTAFGIPCQ